MSRARAVLALAGAGLALGTAEAAAATEWAPTDRGSYLAEPVQAADARARPGAGRVVRRVAPVTRWGGGPVGLMVLDRRSDADDRAWLKVRLAARPNDAAGWIPADVARVRRTVWRFEVLRRRREVRVYRRGRLVRRARVVIGAPATPTPRGSFAVWEEVRQPPGTFLGRWALHLTAHSTVLEDFGGGPGRVALHGRGGASFADPLGSARSHGCVRMDDRVVAFLARVARPGVPVRVR